MAKPKFIQLLQGCRADEWSELELFFKSPYHNTNTELNRMLTYLRPFWPTFPDDSCAKPVLFRRLFPQEPYQDKKLRYLFSDGCRIIEQFWTIQAYRHTGQLQQMDYLDQLSQRGLNELYEKELRKMQKHQNERPQPQADSYYQAYKLAANQEKHFERQRRRVFDYRIQQAAQALDRFYFFHQLNYACGMLEREIILKGQYDLNFSPAWIQHLEAANFFEDPQIELFYRILQMQRHPEEEHHFLNLQQFLRTHQNQISIDILRSGYLAAINYCLRNLRKGKDQYLAAALDLYTEGLRSEALLDEGIISPWTFNNTVKLALRLERYNWIESFIEQYQDLLPENFRENVMKYSKAELYYYTHRYDEAQIILNQVDYTDLNYYLGARVILAKIYYETEEIEPLLSLIAAFNIFLKRNKKISEHIKKTYLNFCDLLFQITKNRKDKMPALHQRIQDTSLLTDRSWLLDQVNQLMS